MIRHTPLVFLATVMLLAATHPTRAQSPARWQLDPVHSRAAFSVRHLGISNVVGEFTHLSGSARYDGNSLSTASVRAVLDVMSVNTRNPQRDADLKSANFFDAEKYPTITFVSERLRPKENGRFELVGNLTIHGVTRRVVLDGNSLTGPIRDPWGHVRFGASATTTINRRDFGLTWSKTLDSGGLVVGDRVRITLDVEMVKQ